ncbi:hypothetical protein ACN38_g7067 [Penicillium nordicum]|uniref:Uncharacterized protein n=1 Tax=Penicillium nordicum TaxID=229535 RepID=A0A0M9WER7_9EURO|nr:hypothetical protein ACN38_g7067 [Penicillium nordicum]
MFTCLTTLHLFSFLPQCRRYSNQCGHELTDLATYLLSIIINLASSYFTESVFDWPWTPFLAPFKGYFLVQEWPLAP